MDLPTEGNPVVVYEDDCRELLKRVPADAVDAVITDPPYGISLASHGTRFRGMRAIAGDESQQIGQAVIDLCLENGWPVAAFADPAKRWVGKWRQELVWDKGEAVGIGGDRRTCWKFTWELIQVGQFPEVYGDRDGAVLRYPVTPSNYADHPAAKPLALMRYLVRKLVKPGGLVLDPFGGSGSTAVACVMEGRRCLLVEKDPEYALLAQRRVSKAMGAGSLFAGATP